jgi:hypothetical protein
MSGITTTTNIINLVNAALPGILLLIKRKDGSLSVGILLDEADANFDRNIKQVTDWFKDHPLSSPVPPPGQ